MARVGAKTAAITDTTMALGTNVETGAGQVELRQELTDAVDTLPPQQWAVLRGLYKTHTGGTVPRT